MQASSSLFDNLPEFSGVHSGLLHDTNACSETVAGQLGREPRTPFRVLVSGGCGYPLVIASPSLLDEGSRFPNWTYLVCPILVSQVSALESEGAVALYAHILEVDEVLQGRLLAANEEFKKKRLAECVEAGQESDVCVNQNLAGQADPLKPKCLHAHVAYRLAGLDDPLGEIALNELGSNILEACNKNPFCQKYEKEQKCVLQ